MLCTRSRRNLICALFAACLFIWSGCSDSEDNPAGPDDDHAEAFGTALIVGTDTLVVVNGNFVTGSLAVMLPDTLGPIQVWFLDESGAWFRPEAHDHVPLAATEEEVVELDVRVEHPAVATVRLGHEDGEEFEWAFYLNSVAPDTTTLRIALLHEGHDDYVSPRIPVAVTAAR